MILKQIEIVMAIKENIKVFKENFMIILNQHINDMVKNIIELFDGM